MKWSLILLLIVAINPIFGRNLPGMDQGQDKDFQEKAAKGQDTTLHMGWTYGIVSGLNLTQVSFKDWVPGGENALSYSLNGMGSAVHRAERTQWSNMLKLTFGQTRLGNQGLRKTDDEIYFESLLIYILWTKINPYAAFTLRTQFGPGYNYFDDGSRVQVSKFFDPAYLTQSAGMAWQPSAIMTVRLGVGLREVITSKYPGYADDPETGEIEKTRIDGGVENVTSVVWPFAENMVFTSRLELFAPFNAIDRIIVRNDNIISAQVNKYIAVNFNVQLINDVNVSPKTQFKEALSIGVTYTFL